MSNRGVLWTCQAITFSWGLVTQSPMWTAHQPNPILGRKGIMTMSAERMLVYEKRVTCIAIQLLEKKLGLFWIITCLKLLCWYILEHTSSVQGYFALPSHVSDVEDNGVIFFQISSSHHLLKNDRKSLIKDGAYYCYCAYVLRIARYSGFLWVVPNNTGIFLCGLKIYGESRTCQMLLVSQKKKLGVTMHLSQIIKLQFRKKSHTLLYILRDINVQLSLKNAWLPPIFFLDSNSPC